MRFSLLRIFSYVLALAGFSLSVPLCIAVAYGENRAVWAFAVPALASVLVAAVIAFAGRNRTVPPLDVRSAFTAVGGAWVALGLFGAVPLWLSGAVSGFTDAVFESVSGFATTGATVIADVESLPVSVNVWRCEMHWLGGMGVIALVVALVPLLGIGGFRLIQAETTGLEKGRLTPRITNTAKALWFIYFGFTALQTVLLNRCGYGWIDSLCHAFSTLGSGGFSTRNASVGAFANASAEWVFIVFMTVAAINFPLYYRLLTGRTSEIWRDSELRIFLAIVAAAVTLVTAVIASDYASFTVALRDAAFQVTSIISTTGFRTSDYTAWCPAAQIVIFALFLVGGCSGSTAGGVKVVRWAVLGKQLVNEFRRLLHPRGVYTVRLNGQPGREALVPGVASFFFAYLLLVAVSAFFGAISGLPFLEALTGAFSMVGNVGPAFGSLGPSSNYAAISDPLKWWYSFAMLAGRLEIYTLFILAGGLFSRVNPHARSRAHDEKATSK